MHDINHYGSWFYLYLIVDMLLQRPMSVFTSKLYYIVVVSVQSYMRAPPPHWSPRH